MTDSTVEQVSLAGGGEAQLRTMSAADRLAVVEFARSLPEEDLLFLSMDITQEKIVDRWIRQVERQRTQSIVAYEGDQLIGYATVHRNPTPWMRRIGEIRVNVAPDYRSKGLGRLLIHRIFDEARTMGVEKLIAQMTADQTSAQNAFRRIGFVPEAMLADFVIDRDGVTRDLVMMTYDVMGHTDQAGDAVKLG